MPKPIGTSVSNSIGAPAGFRPLGGASAPRNFAAAQGAGPRPPAPPQSGPQIRGSKRRERPAARHRICRPRCDGVAQVRLGMAAEPTANAAL